jgi:hypothetical protein
MFRLMVSFMLAAPLLASLGCGGSGFATPEPVSGRVFFQDKPVEGARVTFLSTSEGGRSASGTTDSQGNFSLTTFKRNDGAIPGDYVVTISKFEGQSGGGPIDISEGDYGADYGAMMEASARGDTEAMVGKAQLPEKYGNPADSGLQRSVVKGQPNEFEFDL